MKADRKPLLLQLILNGTLLLGIILSAKVCYTLIDHNPEGHILLQLSFINCVLLLVVFVIANIMFDKYARKPAPLHKDLLTGFMTRHTFSGFFQQTLLEANRTLEPLSVLLIDIDHFKQINEKYGHKAGDEVLTMLATSIQSLLRASDVSCRWQGDQFLILLKDCSTKDCCHIAEKIHDEIRNKILHFGKKKICITTSMGIAQMNGNDDIESLAARAETGLHTARDNGRNTYAIGYDWILIDYSCEPIF
jgi:diguanylate cyclase (GGDEF)-like protein